MGGLTEAAELGLKPGNVRAHDEGAGPDHGQNGVLEGLAKPGPLGL